MGEKVETRNYNILFETMNLAEPLKPPLLGSDKLKLIQEDR